VGWWRSLLRWAEAPTAERNDAVVTFSHDIPTPIDDVIRAGSDLSAAPVRRDLALTVPAVLRGRNLLCSIATLPLVTRDRDRIEVRAPLLEQIDPNVANVVTLAQTVEDLVFDGISWWRVAERMADGFPRRAVHVDAGKVSVNPPPGTSLSSLRLLPSGEPTGGVVWVDGRPVPGREMVRFDSPNPGVLKAAARSIRRALLFERAAAMYATDPRAQDYFTPAVDADPVEDDEIEEILDEWRAARRTRSTAYVPASLAYHTVDAMSPADLQLVELQRQAVVEIANAFGLDTEDLQVSTTSRTYQNATDRRRDRINDTLSPYMRAITDRLSMNDITRRGQTVAFDLDDYMRADPTTRWNTYAVGLSNRIVSVPEVREMEGLSAVPVEPAPQSPPRPPGTDPAADAPPQQEETGSMTRPSARALFSDQGGAHEIAFVLSDVDAEFRVNREKRTISGLIVPWDKVAGDRYGFAKWRFSRDSLEWTDTSRVKLNRDHDRTQAVGVATRIQSTPKGLDGSFRIARGEEGDKVLSLAEDGVLDGFSIEADFAQDGSSWARDPDDDLVRVVHTGRLVGVAITASPAYDDARVSSVAATRREPVMPPERPKGHEQETPAAPAGPDTAAFTAAVEAFTSNTGAFTDAIRQLVEVQQRAGEGPAVVDPTRPRQQFSVTEEPLYRFDGSRGKHDFSSDVIAMSKKDHEAEARVLEWIKAHFVTSANVDSLNPDRQRPDLYVDQLEYPTPLWDSVNKGTLSDNTPFVLPKFNTAAGLVNNHTEGIEPTPGSFTTTSQTITPSAVSGKVEITREAWDQGGNPQLSVILWRQIVREYYEALEQATADMLEALTVAEVTLTAGAVDGALASEVKQALAALQFIRGGFRFRDYKLEQGLYQALVDATDSNGRPLFPVLGAQNADGTTGSLFGAINIAGLAGMPAWALPFTEGAASNSYLYNREDVHGWASAPQRLDFEYRVAYVDVGVWGYKALACTRTDGVRRFVYDNNVA
jgi:HK97 family phage prohead protease